MKQRSVPKRAMAHLRALCAQAWPAEILVPMFLDGLHAVIPSARNLFDWTDGDGRLLHYFVKGPIDTELARLYFEHFHNGHEAACMPAFATLRDAPAGVRGARELDHPAFFASDLYRAVWRPQGLHTRMEGVVRSRSGQLLGSLVLYRGPRDAPFTAFEEGLLTALLPALAQALQRGREDACRAIEQTPHVPAREPAETLLLDLQGRLLHASAGATRLLLLAAGGPSRDTLLMAPEDLAHRLLGRLIAAARERACNPAAAPARDLRPWPSVSMFSAFGRFDAHGLALQPRSVAPAACPPASDASDADHAQALLQITLRRLEPRQVAAHRALSELPIPVAQAAVGAALYQGLAQADIARRLGVAPSTVTDHARKLYCTLDVAGATGLRSLLDHRIAAAAC